jgi:Calcineurin-like phosphoesterase
VVGLRAEGAAAAVAADGEAMTPSSGLRRAGLIGVLASATLLVAGCHATQVHYESTATPPAESVAPLSTLFLVGDAGEDNPNRAAVLAHLTENVTATADGGAGPPVVVVYLGDNIYEEGVRPDHVEEDTDELRAQIAPLDAPGDVRGIFVPGNHDWAKGASLASARAALERQSEWVRRIAGEQDVRVLPEDACPGPAALELAGGLHLVFVDTEWLLRSPEDACGSPEAFYERLEAELATHGNERVILMSHHPMASGGPHGGNVAPLERGPFVFYLASKAGASVQDLASGRYSAMSRELRRAFEASGHPPLIHAAGHDHTLQVIGLNGNDRPRYQLVSGSGSKSSPVRRIDGMRYATDGYGYMRLDTYPDHLGLTVYARARTGGPVRAVFTCSLADRDSPESCAEAPLAGGMP